MTFHSIGDLASSMILSRSTAQAKLSMQKLSSELTTGLKSDLRDTLRGDFASLSSWEKVLSSSEIREKTLAEAMARAQAKQAALETISDQNIGLTNDISLATTSRQLPAMTAVSASAKDALAHMVSALNVTSGGQTLFGGAQTNGAALENSDAIYAAAKTAVIGAITANDVIDGLQIWMDDALGGYDAVAYMGSTETGAPVRLSASQTTQISGRADDPEIKAVVQNLLLAALTSDDDLALAPDAQRLLLERSSNGLRNSEGAITMLRASVGDAEAGIANAKARTSSAIAMTQQLRLAALEADPYETATKFQQAEMQLEKIYTLTARTARMSLLEYLR